MVSAGFKWSILSIWLIFLAALFHHLIEISRSYTINPFTILVIHKFCLEWDACTLIKNSNATKTQHMSKETEKKMDGVSFLLCLCNRTSLGLQWIFVFISLGFVPPRNDLDAFFFFFFSLARIRMRQTCTCTCTMLFIE